MARRPQAWAGAQKRSTSLNAAGTSEGAARSRGCLGARGHEDGEQPADCQGDSRTPYATSSHPGGPYPLLTAVEALLPALLRWTGYGFLFGYFYPLLRGSTGLAKALWLSAAAAGPTLLDLLLTPASVPVWTRMVVSLLQLATFAMTVGLWADQKVLAQHSYHLSRPADVHNLGSLTTWASTVTAAFGAGIAALLLVGAQPFVTGLVQPPSLPLPRPQRRQPTPRRKHADRTGWGSWTNSARRHAVDDRPSASTQDFAQPCPFRPTLACLTPFRVLALLRGLRQEQLGLGSA
ncbi:hypothetical protein GCM10018780_89700 [Streptomyces lanatus]|nr:hypothetical protein GCM10018780_89700 [Streptomyces lanatus]